MKRILLILWLPCALHAAVEPQFAERMANAIYRAEGGAKAKSPYGILSVKVRDEKEAREVCLRSIRNNWLRWEKSGKPGTFVDFMADRWCPPSADYQGNLNWKKNVNAFLK